MAAVRLYFSLLGTLVVWMIVAAIARHQQGRCDDDARCPFHLVDRNLHSKKGITQCNNTFRANHDTLWPDLGTFVVTMWHTQATRARLQQNLQPHGTRLHPGNDHTPKTATNKHHEDTRMHLEYHATNILIHNVPH